MSGKPADPLHWSGPSRSAWTTVNISEAMPNVPTPLTWSFYESGIDRSFFRGFHGMGVISRDELTAARSVDDRSCAIFYGHPALNVAAFRAMAARIPGSSGDAVERQLFGGVRFGPLGERLTRRRYPLIMLRSPALAVNVPGRLLKAHRRVRSWWQRSTASPPRSRAMALLAEAHNMFCAVYDLHFYGTMFAQGAYERLVLLAERAGRPGLETRLVSGYGDIHELSLIADVWHASRGRLSMPSFLAKHGYHAMEGELLCRSWREDPTAAAKLVDRYRGLPDGADPSSAFEVAAEKRAAAEELLVASLPMPSRPAARAALLLSRRYLPCREVGKAAYLLTLDVARAAARAVGEELSRRGVLEDADDVFYFTYDEIVAGLHDHAGAAAFRRARRQEYQALSLPESWRGTPEPSAVAEQARSGGDIRGLPASDGAVEGRARIITDPTAVDLEPGDVMVCTSTDPSWAPVFYQAAGVVIDVGGTLSHGAIVARELGLPCVINTRVATTEIPDGSRVRIDGNTGTVTIL